MGKTWRHGDRAEASLDGNKIVIRAVQSQVVRSRYRNKPHGKRGKYQFRQFGYSGIVTDVRVLPEL